MTQAPRLLAAALWGITVFAAVYLLGGALHLTGLLYDPAAHSWLLATAPSGVQMRYYSDFGSAAIAGLLAFGLRSRLRNLRFDISVLTGAALAVVALDLAWFFSRVLAARRG